MSPASSPSNGRRRVCLLTGAGGRLGSAFCRKYSGQYQIVAVWFRRRPIAATQGQYLFDPLAPDRRLPANRYPVHDMQADLRASDQIEHLVRTVIKRHGMIDVVVNAAVASRWSSLLDGHSGVEEVTESLSVNVAAPLALVAEVARQAWQCDPADNLARNRCVVNVSSSAGIYVYPGQGQGVYSASKAALNILTGHLASELQALGVRANALAPDSFPGRVPIARVLDGVVRLAEGDETGRILLQLAHDVEHDLDVTVGA
jgi:NAD(P)-dependent dehydrogenase (short-subunit alcohol dehydrogenase family)